MADHEGSKLHIMMYPWLAFGHMIPYLELSKHIASRGHKVSFVSTPRNIDRLPKLPPNLASRINFVKLPLPPHQNLPENAEATIDLPYDKVKYLKLARDALQETMAKFLEEFSPDWILHDFDSYWLAPVASKLGVSTALFSIFTPPTVAFFGRLVDFAERTKAEDYTVPPKWIPFKTTVAFRLYEILRIIDAVTEEDDNVSDIFRLISGVERCDIVAVRGCSEFDSEWLKLLENIHQKPVFPVGQLPTTAYDAGGGHEPTGDSWKDIKAWLDKQETGKVIYVAFGSEAKPSQTELTEIALGLELSGFPFFWVLRARRGEADPELIHLPEGFEERTKGRGIVCTSWAPQLKILSHESVGGFLTHSGWSSVVEAIQFEKPLVLLTFLADQGLNARVLEEKKIGYSVPRDERDGRFTREAVAESLRLVVVEKEGNIYREKIKEMKGLFCDQTRQDGYVDTLLHYLHCHKSIKYGTQTISTPELRASE
ncbi:PREDICTED: UDP-glycosyltransferase 91A1-like isoform X1 [Ipomoea nil]|uniref:UDP-glycosyltransferase 91A1-like isoform X1 n=1 Tax=Ipomoea nil TaxID=35883 RepID=UPI00090138B5|nr:PREDICTED: UDP-glycosyltransferase 91A1-like isoform X1 [Ipomoea nil]